MLSKFRLVFVLYMVPFLFISSSWAKPVTPPGLLEILEVHSEFESSYENGEWNEARKILSELAEKLEENNEYIQKHEMQINDFNYIPIINMLAQSVANENTQRTENFFISYQMKFFVYLNAFDYEYHPMLLTIKKYISDEAKKAAEEGNYSEVESELKEVLALYKEAQEILIEGGVSDIELKRFSFQLRKTINDCQANPDKVKKRLENLEKTFQVFHEKVHN